MGQIERRLVKEVLSLECQNIVVLMEIKRSQFYWTIASIWKHMRV